MIHKKLLFFALFIVLNASVFATETVTDVGRLYPVTVESVEHLNQTAELQQLVSDANINHKTVSISGSKHSQGSQTAASGAVVLDMKGYNEVLSIDTERKQITVQSGATWDTVQRAINPHGLAIKVMQSSNIFTVGGTMSANAHGRDLNSTAFVETIDSFRFLLANGTIVNVSRTENSELFKLVIGGYGMFGVILDATINLTDNAVYRTRTIAVDYTTFPDYFKEHIKNNESIALMLVRPSINPDKLYADLSIMLWEKTDETTDTTLTEEAHVARDKFFFGLSRKYDWGKKLRWWLQKHLESSAGRLVTRNNAMRPPEAPLELLVHTSPKDTDILQEYFIPIDSFVNFSTEFKRILAEDNTNVISFTIRYVHPNNETALSYAPVKDTFAVIYYSNIPLTDEGMTQARATQRKIITAAIDNGGTYYLTYNLFPTVEQLRAAYPTVDDVFLAKRVYDPNEVFRNSFYNQYVAEGVGQ